jgi:hypothetical protein
VTALNQRLVTPMHAIKIPDRDDRAPGESVVMEIAKKAHA